MLDALTLAYLLSFQAPLICIVLCLYTFFSIRRNGLTQNQFSMLRALSIGVIVYMLFEYLNGLIIYGEREWELYVSVLLATGAYGALLFNTVMLTEFCLSRVHNPSPSLVKLIRILYYVAGIVIISRIALMTLHLFTYLDEEGNLCYTVLENVPIWICLIITALLTVVLFLKHRDKSEYFNLEKYSKPLIVSTSVTVVLIIYSVFYMPYIVWMVYMIGVLVLFTGQQSLMIDRDELTTLNNRRRLLKDIENKCREKAEWSYLMSDINQFKVVNDEYGHTEGDNALKIVASVLSTTAHKYSAEAYRIGGDEFAVLMPTTDDNTVARFKADARAELTKQVIQNALAYDLNISFGSVRYGEDGTTAIPDIIDLADRRMYEDKRNRKNMQ